jgi:hypothetical protein
MIPYISNADSMYCRLVPQILCFFFTLRNLFTYTVVQLQRVEEVIIDYQGPLGACLHTSTMGYNYSPLIPYPSVDCPGYTIL